MIAQIEIEKGPREREEMPDKTWMLKNMSSWVGNVFFVMRKNTKFRRKFNFVRTQIRQRNCASNIEGHYHDNPFTSALLHINKRLRRRSI